MTLKINTKKTLFVAYPWDVYIKSMYQDIFNTIFDKWDIRHGSDVTMKSKDESEVEEFMNRNKHLYDIFVSAIEKSNFFIADVTGTNPNVMLELGVAIQLNKNILIVTNDNLAKLPFDIRGFKVSRYESKDDLIKIIKNELRVFTKIKSQDFDDYFDEFYFDFPSEGELKHGQILPLPIPRNIKNFRLQIEYKFLKTSNSHDWFGIHLRAKTSKIIESELVYVRENKKIESVSFPVKRTPVIGKKSKKTNLLKKDDFELLELIIEENTLKAITPHRELEDNQLHNENLGVIVLHAFAHFTPKQDDLLIRFKNIKIINLDTASSI